MKSSFALSAFIVSIVAGGAIAAENSKPPATDPTTATKSHSHMMEKTGVPASKGTPAPADGKTATGQDKSKHSHPRDGK